MIDIAYSILKTALAVHEAKLAELDAANDAARAAHIATTDALEEQAERVRALNGALRKLHVAGFGPPSELEEDAA